MAYLGEPRPAGGLAVLGVVFLSTTATIWAAGGNDGRTHQVTVPAEDRFTPFAITIHPGDTVRWVNNDSDPHTVVSDDKVFKSKVLDTDEKFSYTFTKPGAYPYFCSVHPKMTARIVVQE